MYLLDLNLMFLLHWFSKDRKEKHGVHVLAQIYDFCGTPEKQCWETQNVLKQQSMHMPFFHTSIQIWPIRFTQKEKVPFCVIMKGAWSFN